MHDIEKASLGDSLSNQSITEFAFDVSSVQVQDRNHKPQTLKLLENVQGDVQAGQLMAIMGPSGSGKSTLLNALANRPAQAGAHVEAAITVNGQRVSDAFFRHVTAYVEQEDTLIGSLTVRETLTFAGRLSFKGRISSAVLADRVDNLITRLGLLGQSDHLVGTPIRKGISGGQKRRLSIASQLITGPRILFLDEPTSGLDSSASFEVITLLKAMARDLNLIIVASIHQPSTAVFNLFDKLLLLSRGKPVYCGAVGQVHHYFQEQGHPMPTYVNPAEFLLGLVNTDFAQDTEAAEGRLQALQNSWTISMQNSVKPRANVTTNLPLSTVLEGSELKHPQENLSNVSKNEDIEYNDHKDSLLDLVHSVVILTERSFIKSYRDILAYGIRILMYLGLAIMMGTVWLRLHTDQKSIQSFINAIFFGGAFMSFMAVAYIPAFLEDRSIFVKERANGLYGSAIFLISNLLVGLPYLFIIDILFSIVSYWLTGFQPTARAFFMWVMWLYLDLLAAESLVVLISSLIPIFVVALAGAAFANGLWMSVGGFLVPTTVLNVFWKYVFHYIDYQAYVFQGMMVNEFKNRSYSCDTGCVCMYDSPLQDQCRIAGGAVLDAYGYGNDKSGLWVGILICIILVYRLLAFVALWARRI